MSKQTHRTCVRMSAKEYSRLMERSRAAGLPANAWLMEQKANITIDNHHITVERMQTACGREIRVISVFSRHGSETVEDKLKALAELDFRQGKLCA